MVMWMGISVFDRRVGGVEMTNRESLAIECGLRFPNVWAGLVLERDVHVFCTGGE